MISGNVLDWVIPQAGVIRVKAISVGDQIAMKRVDHEGLMAVSPLTLAVGGNGCVVLFRYGVAVFFNVGAAEEDVFLAQLRPYIKDIEPGGETEEVDVFVEPEGMEGFVNNRVQVRWLSIERVQIIADVLAKCVTLNEYELHVSRVLEQIQPMAESLRLRGKSGKHGREMMKHIGNTLHILHKTVGRVEVTEKPELIWEHPELERFYLRLADEYELSERHYALENKLRLISLTAETVLDLLQHKSSLRVEWYIVILIMLDIALHLYETYFRG